MSQPLLPIGTKTPTSIAASRLGNSSAGVRSHQTEKSPSHAMERSQMAYSAIRLLFVGKSFALERECQRHLYLPWRADGMGHITKAGRAVIETAVSLFAFGVASGGQSGLAHGRE